MRNLLAVLIPLCACIYVISVLLGTDDQHLAYYSGQTPSERAAAHTFAHRIAAKTEGVHTVHIGCSGDGYGVYFCVASWNGGTATGRVR